MPAAALHACQLQASGRLQRTLPRRVLLALLLLHLLARAMAAAAAPRAFTLRPGTRLVLQRADLTKFPFSGAGEGCAIVNAANER